MNNVKIDKEIIIFSGYNNRAIIAFCRFADQYGLPYSIIASSERDYVLLSEYKKKVKYIRTSSVLDIDEVREMISTVRTGPNVYILPSSEYLVRFFLINRAFFEELKIFIPVVEIDVYKLVSDKYSFSKICEQNGLTVPKDSEEINDFDFPFVIKPKEFFDRNNSVQFKPIIVKNKSEQNRALKIIKVKDYYCQEYIEGKSFYLLYHISKFGKSILYSQENLIQQADGASLIASKSSNIHNNEIATSFLNLLKKIGFWGLIMIEVKYFNGKYYMIEANPRLWGPSQLFVDANVGIFHQWLHELDFALDEFVGIPKEVSYFWSGGLIENLLQQKEIAFHDYSAQRFFLDYHHWVKADLYLREDTLRIHFFETHK